MHYFTDIQIVIAACAAVLHFLGSLIAFWVIIRRTAANGRGIAVNHVQLTNLGVVAVAAQKEIESVQAGLDRLRAILEHRTPADVVDDPKQGHPKLSPAPRMDGGPQIDGKVWPLGG